MKSYLTLIVGIAFVAALVATGIHFFAPPNTERQPVLQPANLTVVQQGRDVYSEHCASCHGANLEGQPNWRQRDQEGYLPAPPHDASGHTWHHSDRQLFELTKIGVGAILGDKNIKTRMPAYKGILTDHEILAVLSYIKSSWPTDVRARHDQINAARQQESK